MRHAAAIAAIATPTVNSYKRLQPRLADGTVSWAPVFAAYGDNNRSCMLRLPRNRPAVENRGVDSAANTYLAAAFMLAAGLEGIREGSTRATRSRTSPTTGNSAARVRRGSPATCSRPSRRSTPTRSPTPCSPPNSSARTADEAQRVGRVPRTGDRLGARAIPARILMPTIRSRRRSSRSSIGREPEHRYSVHRGYVDAVADAGGLPIVLPAIRSDAAHERALAVIEQADGLLLTGGGDLDPRSYDDVVAPEVYDVDPVRDRAGDRRVPRGAGRRTARPRHLPRHPAHGGRVGRVAAPAPPERGLRPSLGGEPPVRAGARGRRRARFPRRGRARRNRQGQLDPPSGGTRARQRAARDRVERRRGHRGGRRRRDPRHAVAPGTPLRHGRAPSRAVPLAGRST
jgi:hypothetical protein